MTLLENQKEDFDACSCIPRDVIDTSFWNAGYQYLYFVNDTSFYSVTSLVGTYAIEKFIHWAKTYVWEMLGYSEDLETTKISSLSKWLNKWKCIYTF